jgi:hypothetical protein
MMNRTAWMIISLAATMLLGMMRPADTKATTEPTAVAETRTEVSQLRTQFSAEQLSRALEDASQCSMLDPEWTPIDETQEENDGTQFVTLNGSSQCASGSCNGSSGIVYASARSNGVWYPGKRLVSVARSRRSSGNGWFPGKNLGRLFGRRR